MNIRNKIPRAHKWPRDEPVSLSGLPARAKRKIFIVCVTSAVLTVLDLSKINVGLPSLENSLHADAMTLQLIVAGFILAYGLTLVPAGRLGDAGRRKSLLVIGLTVFGVASLLCAIAPNAGLLIVARLLQGFGAGILPPQVLGLIQELYQGPQRARAFGAFAGLTGVAMAVGPALGGVLIQLGGAVEGWRMLFSINVPLTAITLFCAIVLLPRSRRSVREPLDIPGVMLLGLTVLSLMLPFVLTSGADTDPPARWWALAVTPLGAAAFVLWERRYKRRGLSPAVDIELLRSPVYRNGLAIATVSFAAQPAALLLATLYLQHGLGQSALSAGLIVMPFAIALTVTAALSARFVARFGRRLVLGGLIVSLAGYIGLTVVAVTLPPELVLAGMIASLAVAGLGAGASNAPNLTLTLNDVPIRQGGLASSMMQLGQRTGNAVGIAIAVSLYFVALGASDDFRAAFGNGLLVVCVFTAIAIGLAVIDLSRKSAG